MTAHAQCQRSCAKNDGPLAVVQDVLRAPGRPLDRAAQRFFTPRFDHRFSRIPVTHALPQKLAIGQAGDAFEQEADRMADAGTVPGGIENVRLHDDPAAARSAAAIGARAYTVGSHVVFGAGEYQPHTAAGRHLIAHELAHVGQQSEGRISPKIQRSLTVAAPTTEATNQPPGATTPLTNAQLVQSWIDSLCPAGKWSVNATTGALSSPNRDTFCTDSQAETSFRRSGNPVSCKCLCDVTASDGPTVVVHTTDFTVTDSVGTFTSNMAAGGEGATAIPRGTRTTTHVGASGKSFGGAIGAGATSPQSGSGRNQSLPDPPWLIFAHELCGHGLAPKQDPGSLGRAATGHVQTPGGKDSAIDVENRIRREHSTAGNSLGIREGSMLVTDVKDETMSESKRGSFYVAAKGETVKSIAWRCNIKQSDIRGTIFTGEGDPMDADSSVSPDEPIFIVGVFWHEVIKDETLSAIATMWEVPLQALRNANPGLPPDTLLPVGKRLLIPAK